MNGLLHSLFGCFAPHRGRSAAFTPSCRWKSTYRPLILHPRSRVFQHRPGRCGQLLCLPQLQAAYWQKLSCPGHSLKQRSLRFGIFEVTILMCQEIGKQIRRWPSALLRLLGCLLDTGVFFLLSNPAEASAALAFVVAGKVDLATLAEPRVCHFVLSSFWFDYH